VWTQRDQIQAYQFLRRRLVSALVSADANHPVSPSKRLVLGTGLGLAAALLVAAVFGVIGLLTPSRAEEWRQGGQVIVEKETGTRYVLGEDGALHPVLTYASARLLAGGDGAKTVTVPAKTLRDVPRGAGVGIPGSPDSLPQKDRLLAGPWTRCTRLSPDRPAADDPIATVLLGQEPSGQELLAGQAILAGLRSGERFLITGGQRHRLVDDAAVVALGYASADSVTVAPAWLNTIPAGRDLRTIDVPGGGGPGVGVGRAGTRIGQVLESEAGEFYLVRADGLAVISDTEAALVLGAAGSDAAYPDGPPRAIRLPAADIATATRSPVRENGYPKRLPQPVAVAPTATLCATGERITVSAGIPLRGDVRPHLVPPSAGPAAEVYVPGGAGAIAAEEPAPGASSGTTYLITDTGLKYPVPGEDAVKALGYGRVSRHGVPASVLALFPTGPTLDPVQARRTVGS
jgi:type VII secretion protein EccB